ncbi:MAG: AAA family ATPase [Cyanobacteriota bacterium]|nr:AAA family ATPase [Cyanobacteriota bacterium]
MARMIPDSIPSKASRGEKRLYAILRDRLPDDFIAYYEPEVKQLKPDFIVLGASFGLLILEVKGWYAERVERANSDFFEVRYVRSGIVKVESYRSPLKQGYGYFAAISDRLKGYPILCNPDGDYKGRLAFPIGVGAIMSNMSEVQSRDENLYSFLEKLQVAYRDELLAWESWSDRELIQRLKDMFRVDFPFDSLTDDQIDTIRGVLYPEVAIKETEATPQNLPEEVEREVPLPPDSIVIVSLDLEQERLARSMKDGHRLISGVAGSGKTLILLARAKVLANRLTEHRILILCFNITLASHLRSLLHSDARNPQYRERIEVRHFHDWARSLLGRLPNYREFASDEEYDEFLGDRVLAVLNARSLEQKWDSVLVDEAHTFSPKWFICCVAALKDPLNGDLMVVSDGSQSLYQRRKFTWKSVGIHARGRSKKLTQNYRNTQEILTAAWNVLQSSDEATEEDPTFPAVEPDAALRHGPKPVLYLARSKAEAVEALIQQARLLCESGYAQGDIAILYRWKPRSEEMLFQDMMKRLSDLGLRTYWITKSNHTKQNYSVEQPGVRIVTALSSLGLEFKVILLLWAEQFADCCNEDLEKAAIARRQLYVAMTRAQDELYLFGSSYARIFGELEKSQSFEVARNAIVARADF